MPAGSSTGAAVNGIDIGWEEILPQPFVCLLLGARGEGKTALGHRLLEVFGSPEVSDRDAYIMGFPPEKSDLLPDWLTVLPPHTSPDDWPEESIVLIHEAHHLLHARRSMDAENLALDELVTVSRHKDSNIIYDTQQSQRLDKNAVAAVDGICVRWPALMQEDFERRAVRPIISDARDALSKYVTVHDKDDFTYVERQENSNGVDLLKKHVYVHADQFRGEFPHVLELADHWSEAISKAYGDNPEVDSERDNYGSKPKSLEEVRQNMADPDDLETRDVSEIEAMLGDDDDDDTADDTTADTADSGGGDGESFGGAEAADDDDDGLDVSTGYDSGMDYLNQMIQSGNRTLPNNFPQPGVGIIIPAELTDEVMALVDQWDLNPAGADVLPQTPGILKDELSEDVLEDLREIQFIVDDPQNIDTAGYDLNQITQALEDEPAVVTVSPAVQWQPPFAN